MAKSNRGSENSSGDAKEHLRMLDAIERKFAANGETRVWLWRRLWDKKARLRAELDEVEA